MKEYPVQRAAVLKPKPDPSTLVFGKTFTDHMFVMDYTAGQGWHDGRIVPYGPIALDPSAMVFHYAQEVFEGLKAYRSPDGTIQLFRPTENIKRINSSCERMCIPPLDEEDALAAITRDAAEIAGISKRVGTLTPGKDADVVVTSGHPFDWNGEIRAVFLSGKRVK